MKITVRYECTTVNCGGKDYLIYFCYLWDSLTGCWVWDEDKLSYNEALERYPLSEYKWEFIG